MTNATRRASTVATLVLTATLGSAVVLAAGTAQATDGPAPRSKAAIEHEERTAAARQAGWETATGTLTKAQVEHAEAAQLAAHGTSPGTSTGRPGATGQTAATGGDAAAWQLATAAALGALLTGAAFVGARQVAQRRPSGHAVAR